MTRVLSLDLARRTGWAAGSTAGVEGFGVHEFRRTDAWNLGEYGMEARVTFRRMIAEVEPDLVVYEQPILRSGRIATNSKGRQFVKTVDTPEKLRKIYGLGFELEVECYRANVKIREANIGSVRAHFLMGKVPRTSDECKIAVKVMARRRGWNILDDNDADALAVLDYQLSILDPKWAAWTTVQRIGAGESGTMLPYVPDAFVGSRQFFPPAIPKGEPESSANGGAGPGNASSTAPATPGETMAIIRPSSAGTRSTLSDAPRPSTSRASRR